MARPDTPPATHLTGAPASPRPSLVASDLCEVRAGREL